MGYWGKGRKNIGDCKRVLLSLRYPSIGSHRWLYLGGGVCEVYSDEGWAGVSSIEFTQYIHEYILNTTRVLSSVHFV